MLTLAFSNPPTLKGDMGTYQKNQVKSMEFELIVGVTSKIQNRSKKHLKFHESSFIDFLASGSGIEYLLSFK